MDFEKIKRNRRNIYTSLPVEFLSSVLVLQRLELIIGGHSSGGTSSPIIAPSRAKLLQEDTLAGDFEFKSKSKTS
jgi:hypothetical protein